MNFDGFIWIVSEMTLMDFAISRFFPRHFHIKSFFEKLQNPSLKYDEFAETLGRAYKLYFWRRLFATTDN